MPPFFFLVAMQNYEIVSMWWYIHEFRLRFRCINVKRKWMRWQQSQSTMLSTTLYTVCQRKKKQTVKFIFTKKSSYSHFSESMCAWMHFFCLFRSMSLHFILLVWFRIYSQWQETRTNKNLNPEWIKKKQINVSIELALESPY